MPPHPIPCQMTKIPLDLHLLHLLHLPFSLLPLSPPFSLLPFSLISTKAGLAAQNRSSSQSYSIYSWSFEQRHVPDWMHSQPLDPDTDSKRVKKAVAVENRKDCVLRAVATMILGVACGALASYVVLCLWRIFGNRRPVVPEEFAMQAKVFEYKKMEVVVVNKSIKDGKQ